MGNLARYACYGKEMLGWIREKMATQESALKGGSCFLPPVQSSLEMALQPATTRAL